MQSVKHFNDDTIAALASPPGPAMRGIIRVSGLQTRNVLDRIFEPDRPEQWVESRVPTCHPGQLKLTDFHRPLPVTVCLWPNHRSYTGQPMAEIQAAGSPPLLESILLELNRQGARAANPGEFTLRAFLSGRIDLIQAEAVLGVIDASHQYGLETALKQLAGGISGPIHRTRDDLVNLLADLEAGLDFVEEDIEFVSRSEVVNRLETAQHEMETLLQQASSRSETVTHGVVVLAGLPNAGKSTLFNALMGRDEAIVSHIQGTTRDFLQARGIWEGLPIELIDTAGWEDEQTDIGKQSQQFRDERWTHADLIVWCTPADADVQTRHHEQSLFASLCATGKNILRVMTKSDLRSETSLPSGNDILSVSVPFNRGLDELRTRVVEQLAGHRRESQSQFVGTTAARTRGSLESSVQSLKSAVQLARDHWGDELIALEIRSALEHLGELVGDVYTDDLLDRIFSKFCIGK
ncbi:MAG: tRNA uridine-5-carboxymethylaminomethyl(34) synthesis GTPase MnmE [Planctomycetaceae bacterium]